MAALRQAQVPVRQRAPAWPLLVPALARGRQAMQTILEKEILTVFFREII